MHSSGNMGMKHVIRARFPSDKISSMYIGGVILIKEGWKTASIPFESLVIMFVKKMELFKNWINIGMLYQIMIQ